MGLDNVVLCCACIIGDSSSAARSTFRRNSSGDGGWQRLCLWLASMPLRHGHQVRVVGPYLFPGAATWVERSC